MEEEKINQKIKTIALNPCRPDVDSNKAVNDKHCGASEVRIEQAPRARYSRAKTSFERIKSTIMGSRLSPRSVEVTSSW